MTVSEIVGSLTDISAQKTIELSLEAQRRVLERWPPAHPRRNPGRAVVGR